MRIQGCREAALHFTGRKLLVISAIVTSFAALAAATNFLPNTNDINIGAFNVKTFGHEKARKKNVMNRIAQIVVQFDIMAIQEIRDVSGNGIEESLKQLLETCTCSPQQTCKYLYESSDNLGRTDYKERYAFFYRPDVIQIKGTYQYGTEDLQNGKETEFERPPFAVHVAVENSELPEFLFIVLHTRPADAEKEINLLNKVYKYFQQKTNVKAALIGGDLNAGCMYWNDDMNVELTKENGFEWLIDSNTATNIAKTKCPYDRFIAVGDTLPNYIRSNSAGPYKPFRVTLGVSDHYPIGVRLRHSGLQRPPPSCPSTLGKKRINTRTGRIKKIHKPNAVDLAPLQ